MNIKRLFFWGALFFLLLGYVLIFEKKPVEKISEPDGTELTPVFAFSQEDIVHLEIIHKNKRVVLKRTARSWQAISPKPKQKLRQEAIRSLLSAIVDAVVISVIADDPKDLSQFGLSRPSSVLNIFLEEKDKPVVFLLGNKTPITISMYAMEKDKNTVIETGTFLAASISSFMANF